MYPSSPLILKLTVPRLRSVITSDDGKMMEEISKIGSDVGGEFVATAPEKAYRWLQSIFGVERPAVPFQSASPTPKGLFQEKRHQEPDMSSTRGLLKMYEVSKIELKSRYWPKYGKLGKVKYQRLGDNVHLRKRRE